jgi:hypothetical protein
VAIVVSKWIIGYKKSVFYISNFELTLVTKSTYKRKIAPEFSVILDFSKMR